MGIKVALVAGPEENLGIKYLSAVLKREGHEVDLFFDPQLFSDEIISINLLSKIFNLKKDLINDICAYHPDLIGFSVHSDFYNWALNLASALKKAINAPVVFGGIHPTSVPDKVIESDAVDMICVGEGEYPLLDLANSIENKNLRFDIKNIWFKDKGQVVKNPLRPLVDVNELPYPDHGIYYKKNACFRIGYHTIASRGCPYSCSYCCHSILKFLYRGEKYYRIRNPDSLIYEISDNLKKYGFKIVRFYDDIFPFEMEWLERFTCLYKKNIGLPFICYSHPSIVNCERIALLKEAGCVEIRLGIQSLDPEIRRNVLNRFESNESIEKAIKNIKNFDIGFVTENIIGLPGQKRNDIISMLEFYKKNRPVRNHFFWLRYYPGLAIERFKENQATGLEFIRTKSNRVFTQGGDTYHNLDSSLAFSLYASSFLPNWVLSFFLQRRFVIKLPSFFLSALNIITNFFSRSYCDQISRTRSIKRYKFYIKKSIVAKIRSFFSMSYCRNV